MSLTHAPSFSLVVGALLLAGCASKPPHQYHSTYGLKGQLGDLTAAEAEQAYIESSNSILHDRTVGRYDKPVRLVQSPQPAMPSYAIKERIEGAVVIEIHFAESGKVEDVTILKSPHKSLTDAVLLAVRRWTISEATVKGKPAKVVARQTFEFRTGW